MLFFESTVLAIGKDLIPKNVVYNRSLFQSQNDNLIKINTIRDDVHLSKKY